MAVCEDEHARGDVDSDSDESLDDMEPRPDEVVLYNVCPNDWDYDLYDTLALWAAQLLRNSRGEPQLWKVISRWRDKLEERAGEQKLQHQRRVAAEVQAATADVLQHLLQAGKLVGARVWDGYGRHGHVVADGSVRGAEGCEWKLTRRQVVQQRARLRLARVWRGKRGASLFHLVAVVCSPMVDESNIGHCVSCRNGGTLTVCDGCPACWCPDCLRDRGGGTASSRSPWFCPLCLQHGQANGFFLPPDDPTVWPDEQPPPLLAAALAAPPSPGPAAAKPRPSPAAPPPENSPGLSLPDSAAEASRGSSAAGAAAGGGRGRGRGGGKPKGTLQLPCHPAPPPLPCSAAAAIHSSSSGDDGAAEPRSLPSPHRELPPAHTNHSAREGSAAARGARTASDGHAEGEGERDCAQDAEASPEDAALLEEMDVKALRKDLRDHHRLTASLSAENESLKKQVVTLKNTLQDKEAEIRQLLKRLKTAVMPPSLKRAAPPAGLPPPPPLPPTSPGPTVRPQASWPPPPPPPSDKAAAADAPHLLPRPHPPPPPPPPPPAPELSGPSGTGTFASGAAAARVAAAGPREIPGGRLHEPPGSFPPAPPRSESYPEPAGGPWSEAGRGLAQRQWRGRQRGGPGGGGGSWKRRRGGEPCWDHQRGAAMQQLL